ncbi:hypothetical protein RND81_12G098500 [Saponaria officinalis]|uniref:RRM domain-containing protein n=1 Tax=Saponaria officinalis TaxID=3572 RepID=A0AAW1H8M0_SAPOF
MGDAYYSYSNAMQQQPQQPPATAAAAAAVAALAGKRPRSDFDVASGQDMSGYYPREDDRAPQRQMRETDSTNQSYNYYLHSGQNPYPGMEPGRLHSSTHPVEDPRILSDPRFSNDPRFGSDPRMGNVMNPGMPVKGHGSNLGSGRTEVSLPPDASSTIFVEGLPSNCTRREVAHIFRPFAGYREVRLVTKESRRPGGDPLVLCFVDFLSPSHATAALNSINGYMFDETDRDSASLRLQYARFPGARSGGGRRGKR